MFSNKIREANQYIKENKYKINDQYRLNYHLMGEYGWINDPNGFCEYKDNYHLFYQHNPAVQPSGRFPSANDSSR